MANHARSNNLTAFTLIELLVVIGIIALLSGMLLAGAGLLAQRARALDTHQRMQSVINGLQQLGQAEGDSAYVIQRDGLGEEFHWVSLRTILTSMDLATNLTKIPPNLQLREAGPAVVKRPDYRLEIQTLWLWRDTTGKYVTNLLIPKLGWSIGNDYFTDRTGSNFPSPIGESLDATMEVMPPSPELPLWYTTKWPNLTETYDGGTLLYTQMSWPLSNWEAPGAATIPPRWSSPWGKPLISRKTGAITTQLETHTLSDLTPLNTIALLQAMGVLAPGAEGIDAYHNDRGTSRPWNDRWGNPLVVVNAVYIAPRYDFDVAAGDTESVDLKGGRDSLLKSAKKIYNYSRAVYIAVGAIGPVLQTPLPSPWTAADDVATLRALWQQIRTTCAASDWLTQSIPGSPDKNSFSNPPWTGVKQGKIGKQRCYLTAPVEIK